MHAVREWLRDAASIAVLTGAGVSAESGVPTFRGAERLVEAVSRRRSRHARGVSRAIRSWFGNGMTGAAALIAQAKPNPGHYALAEVERARPNFTLITQNVDGLHELAGSRNVLRVHGSIWTLRCLDCGREREDRRSPLPEHSAALRMRRHAAPGRGLVRRVAASACLARGRSGRALRPICFW